MTEQQKAKKTSAIAKKLKKNILSPCIKGTTRVKDCKKHDKQDLDGIDNGTLSFDSSKYLKKKASDIDTINTNYDSLNRPSNVIIESPLASEPSTPDSYLKRKPISPIKADKGKGKAESISEIKDVESSDSDDDIPLSQISRKKISQIPSLSQNEVTQSKVRFDDKEEIIEEVIEEVIEEIEIEDESQHVAMPVPVGSKVEEIKNPIVIPAKMEPTNSESEMKAQVDPKMINQSIPMPIPTDVPVVEEPVDLDASQSEYIVEEIITEEIIGGKKRITTETITRKASPKVKSPTSLKMPVAVGSKAEEINIPEKMSPTASTPKDSEGIVDMPMNLPKPVMVKTDTYTSNEVIDLESPLSNVVDENEDYPLAVPMPSIPVVGEIKQTNDSHGDNLSPQPGFNFNTPNNTPVEPGFNLKIINENNVSIPMPMPVNGNMNNVIDLNNSLSESSGDSEIEKIAEQKGFLDIPQPLPPYAFEEKINDDNKSDISTGSRKKIVYSPENITVDEQLKLDELEKQQKQQQLEGPKIDEKPIGPMKMPKTPTTFFKNNNISDSDDSDDEKPLGQILKSSTPSTPEARLKTLEVSRKSDDNDSDDSDDEKPLRILMPKTPSAFYENNNINDKSNTEESKSDESEENIIKIQTPVLEKVNPQDVIAPEIVQPKKMKLTVVNNDELSSSTDDDSESDSDDSEDDEKLINIKQQYEQKKLELEAKIASMNNEVLLTSEEVKEDLKKDIEVVKEDIKEDIEDVGKDIKDKKEAVEEKIEEKIEVKENEKEKEEEFEKNSESESEKKKMNDLKNQISSSFKKHQRSVSLTMLNMKKKVDKSLEQTKEHLKENFSKEHKPSTPKIHKETTNVESESVHAPITENEIAVEENEHETSFQDNLMGSLKRTNKPKSIKSFFGFVKKDKKDKKEKKNKKEKKGKTIAEETIPEESIPEFPNSNLKINTLKKNGSHKSNELHSTFSSLKRLVSPLSSSKRHASSPSLRSNKSSGIPETPKTVTSIATTATSIKDHDTSDTSSESSVEDSKELKIQINKPNLLQQPKDMNDVIKDLKNQASAPPKFEIPLEPVEEIEEKEDKKGEKEKKEEIVDDKASVYSSSSSSSSSSASSSGSYSSSASSSSSSSTSSDEEVLGNIMNKKDSMKKPKLPSINTSANLTKNYTNGSVDNDDFVSIMMVQHMLSASVDRSNSPLPDISSPRLINPYSFIDVEAEKKKSFSKPKAIVTAVNPRTENDTVDTPRSTIIYKFDERPKLDKPILNTTRSLDSLPLTLGNSKDISSSKQRMVEFNLDDSSIAVEEKENRENPSNTEADKRKSAVVDSNLMQMFEDIHNLSLEDIATRYTKPGMIQCDIGPSFLDEVMGSLSLNH